MFSIAAGGSNILKSLPESRPEKFSSFALVAISILCVSIVVSRIRKWSSQRHQTYAPLVPYWTPFGLDLAYRLSHAMISDRLLPFFRELFEEHGRTIELHILGNRMIATDDSENIRALLMNQFPDYWKGEQFHALWGNVLGDSIFTSEGQDWIEKRGVLRPHLSNLRASDTEVFEKHSQTLFPRLVNGSEPINTYDVLDRWGLDVVTEVFFGESMHSLSTEEQPFREAIDQILQWNTSKTLFGPFGTYAPDRFIRGALEALKVQMNLHVRKALEMDKASLKRKPERDRTLLESLAYTENDGKNIRDHLIGVIIAGKDPIGVTLTWALYLLAQNPAVIAALRTEIGSTIGFTEPPTKAQIKDMPYLINVVREVMRLYPPLPFNIRVANTDTTLPTGGGPSGKSTVDVSKGTQVLFCIQTLQRRLGLSTREIPEDGDAFRPERWKEWKPDGFEFLPFNNGPRMCLANTFGELILQWAVARLFQKFDAVEPADDVGRMGKQRIKLKLNAEPAGPVLCIFHEAKLARSATT